MEQSGCPLEAGDGTGTDRKRGVRIPVVPRGKHLPQEVCPVDDRPLVLKHVTKLLSVSTNGIEERIGRERSGDVILVEAVQIDRDGRHAGQGGDVNGTGLHDSKWPHQPTHNSNSFRHCSLTKHTRTVHWAGIELE